MRKIIASVALTTVVAINFVIAQQDPQVSLNSFNHLSVNPGFAGSNEAICASMLHRNQWLGFKGAPRTELFNVHGDLKQISSGIGLSIMQESIGALNNLGMNLNYAYRLKLGEGMLGMGLSFGFYNMTLVSPSGGWKTPDMLSDAGSENPYGDDPLIPHDESKFAFDAGFGLFYRTNDFYAGLSSTHLPQSSFKFGGSPVTHLTRHYYFTAGYFYELPNKLFVLKPGVFIKSDGAVMQYDFNAILEWKRMVWGGLSYRLSDAVVAMAGVKLPMNVDAAIAYDFTTSKIGAYSSGTIEIMLRYCFSLKMQSSRGSYKSVRFL